MKKLAIRGLVGVTFGVGVVLGFACNEDPPKALEAEGCVLDADCSSPLVCAFKLCHAECDPDAGNRDCEDGARCVAESSGGVCLLPEESTCARNSDCPEGLVCGSDGQCRSECSADRDCPVGSVCASGACALEEEVDDDGHLPGETEEGSTCIYASECADGLICRAGKCVKECVADVDCDAPATCDPETGRCVGEGNRCGDGVLAGDEACDDGNQSNQDACSNECIAAACGDGVVQPPTGEFCDDGNTVNDDACSNACRFAACGDGIVQVPEVCDDGNFNDADSCPNDCNPSNCPGGGIECDGACVDPSTDEANCGKCGLVCSAEQVCEGNFCVCPAGGSLCGASCFDLQSDPENCGACNSPCLVEQVCNGGVCECPAGESACGPSCVDLQTDEPNCGACGASCLAEQTCNGGVCECPAGESACGPGCVDFQTDVANCGGCGSACVVENASPFCLSGQCAGGCNPGFTDCDGQLGCEINTATDEQNCGACGNVCPVNNVCNAGVCEDNCRTANGLTWCVNPAACGEACEDVCTALGGTLPDDATWFAAQDSQEECTVIANAWGLAAVQFNSWTYGCLETEAGLPAGQLVSGPLYCSTFSGCPAQHRTNMDSLGVTCDDPGARRSICPCVF